MKFYILEEGIKHITFDMESELQQLDLNGYLHFKTFKEAKELQKKCKVRKFKIIKVTLNVVKARKRDK